VGVICGQNVFGHPCNPADRVNTVNRLNAGELHGIVMNSDIAGVGYNMVGANVLIFLGSMYSQDYESQVAGKVGS
jgi:superfamily II DNA or RNA helicase